MLVEGVRFAVWAPNAEVVSVTADFNQWDRTRHPMRLRDGGIWEIFIPGIGAGECYKYSVLSHTGDLQVREFAREQEQTVELFLDLETPPGMQEWFEQAVNCCAFLAWRLAGKAVGIHFRTQDLDFRLPEEGDVYTVLKYLALVQNRFGKPPEVAEAVLWMCSERASFMTGQSLVLDGGFLAGPNVPG